MQRAHTIAYVVFAGRFADELRAAGVELGFCAMRHALHSGSQAAVCYDGEMSPPTAFSHGFRGHHFDYFRACRMCAGTSVISFDRHATGVQDSSAPLLRVPRFPQTSAIQSHINQSKEQIS